MFHLHPFLAHPLPCWHYHMEMRPCLHGTRGFSLDLCPFLPLLLHSDLHTIVPLQKPLSGAWYFPEGFLLSLAALPIPSYFRCLCKPHFLFCKTQLKCIFPVKSSQLPQLDRSHAFCSLRLHLHLVSLFLSLSVYLPHCQPVNPLRTEPS